MVSIARATQMLANMPDCVFKEFPESLFEAQKLHKLSPVQEHAGCMQRLTQAGRAWQQRQPGFDSRFFAVRLYLTNAAKLQNQSQMYLSETVTESEGGGVVRRLVARRYRGTVQIGNAIFFFG